MNAEKLINWTNNEKSKYDSVVFAVKQLRSVIDIAANDCAAQNSAWHDDKESESHDEYHAPASVQFPREIRDQAILDLVRHYLSEATIREQAK